MARIFTWEDGNPGIELVGGKAYGLYAIQKALPELRRLGGFKVPRFLVVPPGIPSDSPEIISAARALSGEAAPSYWVRSSSILEDWGAHSLFGVFGTEENVPLPRLPDAIESVRRSGLTEYAVGRLAEFELVAPEEIPVIVQLGAPRHVTSTAYSQVDGPEDLCKIAWTSLLHSGRRVDLFEKDATHTHVVRSSGYSVQEPRFERLCGASSLLEEKMNCPVIMEASWGFRYGTDLPRINLLQVRKLTVKEAPEIPYKDGEKLVFGTYDTGVPGEFAGPAFFVYLKRSGSPTADTRGLVRFNEENPDGFVLFTPYLKSEDERLPIPSNARAVVGTSLQTGSHDGEICRERGILYLNAERVSGIPGTTDLIKFARIRTGDPVRIASTGTVGVIYLPKGG
ncbi:MAG: hypothetical protein V1820_04145 [archaeon]